MARIGTEKELGIGDTIDFRNMCHNQFFLGLPGARKVVSRWCFETMASTHRSLPYGTPLFTDCRMVTMSSPLSEALIHSMYEYGKGVGGISRSFCCCTDP